MAIQLESYGAMLEGTSQVLECACAHLPLTFDQRELGEPRGDSLLFGAFRHESGDHDLGTPAEGAHCQSRRRLAFMGTGTNSPSFLLLL